MTHDEQKIHIVAEESTRLKRVLKSRLETRLTKKRWPPRNVTCKQSTCLALSVLLRILFAFSNTRQNLQCEIVRAVINNFHEPLWAMLRRLIHFRDASFMFCAAVEVFRESR